MQIIKDRISAIDVMFVNPELHLSAGVETQDSATFGWRQTNDSGGMYKTLGNLCRKTWKNR